MILQSLRLVNFGLYGGEHCFELAPDADGKKPVVLVVGHNGAGKTTTLRMILGIFYADSGEVTGMVARQGLRVTVVGLVLGLIAAAAGARVLESFLFGVSARDPLTYAAGSLFLGVVATAACWIPARRGGRADPMQALRME